MSACQRDLIGISQKIEKMKKNLRGNQDKRDCIEIENRELRESIKLLQKQAGSLDKMLDDSVEEKALAKDRRNSLKNDILNAQDMIGLIKEKGKSQGSQFFNELSD